MKLEDWKRAELIDPTREVKDDNDYFTLSYLKEFEYAMPLCNDDGWFLEFGVWSGRTINLCSGLKPNATFHGFDSFEGLPEDWVLQVKDKNGGWANKVVPGDRFKVDKLPKVNDNVELHVGWFDEVLPEWVEKNFTDDSTISWLHLDADIYSSTIYVLKELNKYIRPGTIIRFDELVDWRVADFPCQKSHKGHSPKAKYLEWPEGEWKALQEWLDGYDRKVEPLWRSWHQGAGLRVVK